MNPNPEFDAPHCDPDVLHAPASCRYCDEFPQWQALRKLWGIAFTGQEPRILKLPYGVYQEIACPADIRRLGRAHAWPGNQPEAP